MCIYSLTPASEPIGRLIFSLSLRIQWRSWLTLRRGRFAAKSVGAPREASLRSKGPLMVSHASCDRVNSLASERRNVRL